MARCSTSPPDFVFSYFDKKVIRLLVNKYFMIDDKNISAGRNHNGRVSASSQGFQPPNPKPGQHYYTARCCRRVIAPADFRVRGFETPISRAPMAKIRWLRKTR